MGTIGTIGSGASGSTFSNVGAMTMRHQSRRPRAAAVIALLAYAALTPSLALALQEPTQQPPLEQPRTVIVNVVAYSTNSSGQATGSCTPVRITAGGGEGGPVRVGFFETEVGGTGAQWRSAGWMAAVTAALLTGFDPRATRVSFEFEGWVDGPSAGGLMTVGVLAAVRGDPVRSDAAMTGTINPDGTIGPVGGISHKIEGAAAKGMKLVLIPGGIRFDTDGNSGEQVDLVEHGKKLGVEVRPVYDIYTAYQALTGVELPRSPAAAAPQSGDTAQRGILEKMVVWYDRYSRALDAYSKMPGTAKLDQAVIDLYQKGLDILKHSGQMKDEGEFAAALWDRVQAAAYGYLALEAGRCRAAYASGGYDGMVARLRDNDWLQTAISEMAARMRSQTPRTLDQLSVYLSACDALLEAVSLQALAGSGLANLPDEESEMALTLAGIAAENQIIAWLDTKLAGDALDLSADYAGPPIPDEAPWRDTANYLRRASEANLSVFEALIIEPAAKSRSESTDQFRAALMHKDRTYAILQAAILNVFPRLGEYFGDGDALGYASLATSLYSHTRAAGLLAKYYSLGAELDENAQVVGVPRERTLGEWLSFAEDQSRRNIAALQSIGIDGAHCVHMHDIARIKARRDVNEKLEGLIDFWSADLHAQVLHRIGGASRATAKQEASAAP